MKTKLLFTKTKQKKKETKEIQIRFDCRLKASETRDVSAHQRYNSGGTDKIYASQAKYPHCRTRETHRKVKDEEKEAYLESECTAIEITKCRF